MNYIYLIIALSSLSHLQASQSNDFWGVGEFFDRLSGKVTGLFFDELKPKMSDLNVNDAIDAIEEDEQSELVLIGKHKALIAQEIAKILVAHDSGKIETLIEDINILKNEFAHDSEMATWLTEKLNHIDRFLKHFDVQSGYNLKRSSSFDDDLVPVRFDTIDKAAIRKEIDGICKSLSFDANKATSLVEKLLKTKTGNITQEDRIWLQEKINLMETVIQQA